MKMITGLKLFKHYTTNCRYIPHDAEGNGLVNQIVVDKNKAQKERQVIY